MTHSLLKWGPRIGLVSMATYGMTKMSLWILSTTTSITLSDAVYFGLFIGFGSATTAAFGLFTFYNTFDSVRPEETYAKAMKKIAADERVVKLLGPVGFSSGVNSGLLRAYKIDGGDWGLGDGHRGASLPLPGVDSRLVYRNPRIQMAFQVYGKEKQGLVVVEAVKRRGKVGLVFVSLDILDSDETDPIVIHGDESRLYIRDQLTGFVSFKKKYI
eukprot:g3880.t1